MRAFMPHVFRISILLMLFIPTVAPAADLGLSPAAFRQRYNTVASTMNAPAMPEEPAESLAVPDKNKNGKILSAVSIYYLNERISMLLNCPKDTPDRVAGAAIIGGVGEEFTFATATDMQTAMIALLTMLTPDVNASDRNKLLGELGLLEGNKGDFTDGALRRRTAGGILFHTVASENTGIELVARPAPQQ